MKTKIITAGIVLAASFGWASVPCSETDGGVKYEWTCADGETCGPAVRHQLTKAITKGNCKRTDGSEYQVSAGPSGGF